MLLNFVYMSWTDFVITPLVIYIFFRITKNIKDKYYPDSVMGKMLMYGFWAKVLGSIFISCIYEFYYGGGDMDGYTLGARGIYDAFNYNLETFWQIITFNPEKFKTEYYNYRQFRTMVSTGYVRFMATKHFYNLAELNTIKVYGILALFCFDTFTTLAMFISMFTFSASWKLFVSLNEKYPGYEKQLAIACLFIPSIVVWSSGVLKDPITYGCLIYLVVFFFDFIKSYKITMSRFLAALVFFYFILTIKPYILLCAMPALFLYLLIGYVEKIKYGILKVLLFPTLAVVFFFTLGYMSTALSDQLGKYALENVNNTLQSFQTWHEAEAEMSGGSGYTLGDMSDLSPIGILKKFPLAVNVTFFRPYIFEARKPIIMLGALESLFFLLITIRVLYRVGILNTARIMVSDPFITFCIFYALIFGFAVGISSYNFGALTRYKIPCMSFYLLAFMLTEYTYKRNKALKESK